MNYKLLFSCSVLILGSFLGAHAKILAKPRRTCAHSTCVENQGKSGSFKVFGKNKNESDACKILFDAIKEVDADGNQVGKGGPKEGKHSFNTFAPLDFEFSEIKNVTYQNVSAAMFTFSAKIPGPNATLVVEMYFFYGNGSCDVCGKEEFSILPGMVKFNIEIKNWNFCGSNDTCKKGNKNEIGEFIDFTITVQKKGKTEKGKKGEEGKGGKKKAQKFVFGDTDIIFPSWIQKDGGNCSQMPSGYPMMESKGEKHSITFRFSRFKDKVMYDPAMSVDASTSGGGGGGGSGVETTTPSSKPTTDSGSQSLGPMVLLAILGILAQRIIS